MDKSKKQMRLTLDNLSYKCVINENEEIEIMLPCSTLSQRTQVYERINQGKKEQSVVISPANPIKISILFVNKTKNIPTINLLCVEKKAEINGKISLQPETKQIYEFVSVDDGLHWLVTNSGSYSSIGEATIVNDGKSEPPSIIINASDVEELSSPTKGKNEDAQDTLESVAIDIKQAIKGMPSGLAANIMKVIKQSGSKVTIKAPQI